jgi:hypothetical protein
MIYSIPAKLCVAGIILGHLLLLTTVSGAAAVPDVVGLVSAEHESPDSQVQESDELPIQPETSEGDDTGSEATVVELWPFHGKNSTDTDTNTTSNNSCFAAATCEVCNAEHLCHWCAHDSSCHAIGSIHGCLVGSTCEDKKKPNTKNETDPSGCLAHESCSECTLSSHLCHWCAHDNACHAVGSIYGCVTGVDCYDNTHCKRDKPEPFEATSVFHTKVGVLPLLVISVISAIILCCATTCCCIVGGLKGAYDDLVYSVESPLLEPAVIAPTTSVPPRAARRSRASRGVARKETTTAQLKTDGESVDDVPVVAEAVSGDNKADAIQEMHQLVDQDEDAASEDFVRMVDGGEEDRTTPLLPPQRSQRRRHRPGRSIHRLYNACVCCYLVTVAFVGLFCFSAIRYYPQKPVYNICNDSVAWKSLIDSMTAMKVTADFELLASISNPNHFDVAVDMGKGSFSHDGAFVGTYEIPPVTVAAMAITDILIVASFVPEKWQALSITAEYYRGTLVLHVDAEATIRVPALADYTFTATLKDLIVHVNEMSDRHLCACPTWSDTNKTMTTLLPSVPHWVEAS